jgi:hypothetical protein
MNRRLLVYISFILVVFSSCRKDHDVFSESPDQRLDETLAKYSNALTGSPYGWKGLIYPAGLPGTAFGFYFKFDTLNRVQMFSDFDSASAVTMMESSYRLKALQQPSLLFDTYSYVQVLCDPDASVNGGAYGQGLDSDFEFAIDGIYGDTIKLTGRMHGSKALLIKASSEEAQDYYDNKRNWEFNYLSRFLTYFKQFTTSTRKYDITVNTLYRQIVFTWLTEGGHASDTIGYFYTSDGIGFSKPLDDGKSGITALHNIQPVNGQEAMTMTVNDAPATINAVIKPLVVDSSAPQRWWNFQAQTGVYWFSPYAFHVNGVDDALQLESLSGYAGLVYLTNYVQGYDWSGILQGGSYYGPAFKPKFNTNGTVSFTSPGTVFTIPAEAATLVQNLTTKFSESTGYYFVQTGAYTYDMVNVKDARSWISWQPAQ